MSLITESTNILLVNPYKLVNHTREKKTGITASSLAELISAARLRFNIPIHLNITVVLEQDGTEIDDEEYFATLDKNTCLMILRDNEKWSAANSGSSTRHVIFVDDTDHYTPNPVIETNKTINHHGIPIESLVSSLHSEPSHISLLGGTDLEMLSDMDPNSLADIFSDRLFLESLKEVSSRFLADKRKIQDSVALHQMLSNKTEL